MLNQLINVDLHIHSKASAYKEPKGLVSECDSEHSHVLLSALRENNITLFSITDHNRFNNQLYEDLYSEIESNHPGLSLLAGVEFDVKFEPNRDIAHVITIFDAKSADDRLRIKSAIEKNLIEDKGGYYDIASFETLLKQIKLNTILIAHQHSGFNGDQKKRSLGRATDGLNAYKFGYIDALEYNKPVVQGILRSELSDLELPARMVIGSDCHQWSCYPRHDAAAEAKEAFCTKMRALPTFKGLLMALTSPHTRLRAGTYVMRPDYISEIKLCGATIPMSPGINVIIGENGIGKSSLLTLLAEQSPKQKWVKTLKSRTRFSCDRHPDKANLEFVSQGQLQGDYNKNGKVFDDGLFEEVSNSSFEDAVRDFSSNLKSRITANINAATKMSAVEKSTLALQPNPEGTTYSFVVSCPEDFTNVANKWTTPSQSLSTIANKIDAEIGRGSDYYTDEEIKHLQEARRHLEIVFSRVKDSFEEVNSEALVKGVISNSIKAYDKRTEQRSSEEDNTKAAYKKAKRSFVDDIVWLARQSGIEKNPPVFPVLDNGAGVSQKPSQGFKFVRRAKYSDSSDLLGDFLQCFNKAYQNIDKLLSIQSVEDITSAIPSCAKPWEASFDSMVDKFIKAQECVTDTIMDVESAKMGNTLGEMSLTYYRYATSAQSSLSVFMADQPEDNISNNRVSSRLTDYFNDLRSRSQVIIVTHSPLLVVNQDADNVIVLKQGTEKPLDVSFGCLESNDTGVILEEVAEIMDGGKEAIRKRMRAYEAID